MIKQNVPADIYWEKDDESFYPIKDVFVGQPYQETGKIINSTHIRVERKPWLQKNNILKRCKAASVNVDKRNHESVEGCSLKDLCKQDKQKVANLVKELAKFGDEKNEAIKRLEELSANFRRNEEEFELVKRNNLKDQDYMKEKLLEYEIRLEQQTRKICLLQEEKNDSQIANTNESLANLHHLHFTEMKSENDRLAQVFSEQQHKFHLQQKLLKEQIEQLQKLQESVIVQQQETRSRIRAASPQTRKNASIEFGEKVNRYSLNSTFLNTELPTDAVKKAYSLGNTRKREKSIQTEEVIKIVPKSSCNSSSDISKVNVRQINSLNHLLCDSPNEIDTKHVHYGSMYNSSLYKANHCQSIFVDGLHPVSTMLSTRNSRDKNSLANSSDISKKNKYCVSWKDIESNVKADENEILHDVFFIK